MQKYFFERVRQAFLVVALLVLNNCAAPKEVARWDCQEKEQSGGYDCEQVGGSAGKADIEEVGAGESTEELAEVGLATDTLGSTERSAGEIRTESHSPEPTDNGRYVLLDRRADRWQEKLPTLSQADNEYAVSRDAEPLPARQGRRKAEPVNSEVVTGAGDLVRPAKSDTVEEVKGLSGYRSSVIQNILEPTVQNSSADNSHRLVDVDVDVEAEPVNETQEKAESNSSKLYTVQLGAFKSEQVMMSYAEKNGLRYLDDLLGHRTRHQGEEWYVITWGRFGSEEQAKRAWLEKQNQYPGVDYWVRSVNSLGQAKEQVVD